MHTVFLSEPTLFRQENQEEVGLSEHENYQEEISLLTNFSAKHGNSNFDRLPTCPLCLEKLDPTVTGLH